MAAAAGFLPYVDKEFSLFPKLREEVEFLIEVELEKRRKASPFDAEAYLGENGYSLRFVKSVHDPTASEGGDEFLRNELKRVAESGPFTADFERSSRYLVQDCPADDASQKEWDEAIEHNRLILERLEGELMNAELQVEFGSSSWKVYAQMMEGLVSRAKKSLHGFRDESMHINQLRKGAQITAMGKISKLREKWLGHIHQAKLIQETLEKEEETLFQQVPTLSNQSKKRKVEENTERDRETADIDGREISNSKEKKTKKKKKKRRKVDKEQSR